MPWIFINYLRQDVRSAATVAECRATGRLHSASCGRILTASMGTLFALAALYILPPSAAAVAAQAPAMRTGQTKVNPKDGLTYVWIQPGTFTMGCSQGDIECAPNERPAHEVRITGGFWIGQTDVTQLAWRQVKGTDPSHFKGPQLPVETVNWNEAQSYCQTVGMRLPTEAEWEYAARAGSSGSRYRHIDLIGWYSANSGGKTHDVMQKQPNAWGLYDMLGDVWQWTADWYADKYAGNAETDPQGPATGQYRAMRGGSWYFDPAFLRASFRSWLVPEFRLYDIGFRCLGN